MKGFFGFLKARWFLSLLGTIALALLVWFVGPLIGVAGSVPLDPESRRWWVIGTLFVLWALWQIGATILARRRNRRLVEQLAAAPPDPADQATAEEMATLQRRFDEAPDPAQGHRGAQGAWGPLGLPAPLVSADRPPGLR